MGSRYRPFEGGFPRGTKQILAVKEKSPPIDKLEKRLARLPGGACNP